VAKSCDRLFELRHSAYANERARHTLVAQNPGQRHLRQGLTAAPGNGVQRRQLRPNFSRDHLRIQWSTVCGRTARGRHVDQILVGQHALRERRESDAANPVLLDLVE